MGQPFDPEVLLAAPLMANLATAGPDGPRNAPVWYLWEDGALWMPSHAGASSASRLAANPACAVEIVRFDNDAGIILHLGLRGNAAVAQMDAGRFRRLLAKYLGPDPSGWNPWFIETIARIDDPDGRWIRLAPKSTYTNNVSHFRTGPHYAWPVAD